VIGREWFVPTTVVVVVMFVVDGEGGRGCRLNRRAAKFDYGKHVDASGRATVSSTARAADHLAKAFESESIINPSSIGLGRRTNGSYPAGIG